MKHKFPHLFLFPLLLLLLFGCAGSKVQAAASQWQETENTAVRLISALQNLGASRNVKLGLEFKLKKGWKIYWRSPGDAGFPPKIDWTGSKNLMEAKLHWPAPERFSILEIETLGYKNHVILPISAKSISNKQGLNLSASVNYLACKEICIPYTALLRLNLETGVESASDFFHLIDKYETKVPKTLKAHGIEIESLSATKSGSNLELQITSSSLIKFQNTDLLVEAPIGLTFSKPLITYNNNGYRLNAVVQGKGLDNLDSKFWNAGKNAPFTITILDGVRSEERTFAIQFPKLNEKPHSEPETDEVSLIYILLISIIGGFILNFMPCVLPVLSLKILSIIESKKNTSRQIRLNFSASAFGIIFSFLLLALLLILAKAFGQTVGWGVQFQHPWFLTFLAIILVIFACNLWGFFEIKLPRFIAKVGEKTSGTNLPVSNFLQGSLATLLATPCSAPFLGTAVAFSLARGPMEIILVFVALGIGLAVPYIFLALVPFSGNLLPKSGKWITHLRTLLGVSLLITALWVLSILSSVSSLKIGVLIGFLLSGLILLLYSKTLFQKFRFLIIGICVSLCLVIILIPYQFSGEYPRLPTSPSQKITPINWQALNTSKIKQLVKLNKIIFVDITADWCITCKVNKTFVLNKEPILSKLNGQEIVTMQADWTLPDEKIANYLFTFHRYGIPFNIVYGPGAPEGILLPELLRQKTILAAIDTAKRLDRKRE